jgi:biotin transport system substrate-specific component
MVDIRHLLELKLVYSGINFFKRSNKHMNGSLRQIVHTSLFTALIIVGGYLSLPLPFTQIPVVLADFFILLAGLTLGAAGGGMAVALFILLGALGLPVFAGGKAGWGVLFGPTGGFILGYLLEALVAGWVAHQGAVSRVKDALAIGLGNVALFVCGAVWLALSQHLSFAKALALAVAPFMPGTVIKAVVLWLGIRQIRQLTQISE